MNKMTKTMEKKFLKFAKLGCKENNVKVNIKDMTLLESAYNTLSIGNGYLTFINNNLDKTINIEGVVIEDNKNKKYYSISYNRKNYDEYKNTCFQVVDVTDLYK